MKENDALDNQNITKKASHTFNHLRAYSTSFRLYIKRSDAYRDIDLVCSICYSVV
jgi:hypothetical protein